MITQRQLDAISDDFQSTFTLYAPNVLGNLFYENEIPVVDAIIKKHIPGVFINYTKQQEIAPGYCLWTIEVTPDNGK